MSDKIIGLIIGFAACVAAGGIVGGFMYCEQWDTAGYLAVQVVSGFLVLAGVRKMNGGQK